MSRAGVVGLPHVFCTTVLRAINAQKTVHHTVARKLTYQLVYIAISNDILQTCQIWQRSFNCVICFCIQLYISSASTYSKWVLSGAGMRLHQCFPAAPQGIELRRIYAHSYLLSISFAIVYDYLWLFRTLNLFAISIVYAVPRLSATICYLSAILCYYRVLPTTIL